MRLRSFFSSPDHFFKKVSVSRSNASRRLTTSIRSGTSEGVRTSTASPNRSSNCGRNSPSSGLPLPMRTKRAGWRMLRPSRSTTFTPLADTSSKQIDQMILEKIDLVYVEKSAVGLREQARLERFLAARQRAFEIERADHAVLGRAERQVDHGDRLQCGLEGAPRRGGADGAQARRRRRIAMIGAADDGPHFGQKRGQRPHRRRFSGSPVAESEHAADRRIHGCDQEGRFHVFLSDDRREGKRPPHMPEPYFELAEGSPPFHVQCGYWNRGVFQLSDLSNMSAGSCQFKLSKWLGARPASALQSIPC